MNNRHFRFLAALPLLASLAGCGGPGGELAQKNDPQAAAQAALAAYDANSDGQLDESELFKCPALQGALDRFDTNGDKAISSDELVARFTTYQNQSKYQAGSVMVQLKGRPLTEAQVKFEPEPFMGEGLQAYSGQSKDTGKVQLTGEQNPTPGLPIGLYRVTITRAGGEQSIKGVEVADDAPNAMRMVIPF